MKPVQPFKNKKLITGLHAMLLITFVLIMGDAKANAGSSKPVVTKRDSIIINKSQVSKRCSISIYPNASHEVLFFSASGKEGKLYDLYIFNVEGKLIRRTQIRNRETTLMKTFEKGNYFFEVFINDERIENGNMIIN